MNNFEMLIEQSSMSDNMSFNGHGFDIETHENDQKLSGS